MTDLDLDLARRLERLSAAVPVRAGQLDPVHAGAVAARRQIRMRWLTPLVALLVALVAFAVMGGGNDPRPSSDASIDPNGPPVGIARDGDFALTLRADKRNYAPNERINVVGTLTYFGPQDHVEIRTDDSGPIMFGIQEPVYGGIEVGTGSRLMCKPTTLARTVPYVEPFKKGGSFDGENPDAAKFEAFFKDKDLRLPEGTWHLYAVTRPPCLGGDVRFELRTEIEIVVADDLGATPGVPVATPWQDKPVYGGDDIGYMGFQVKSLHPRYEEGAPIDLDTWFWFNDGPELAREPFVQQVEYRLSESAPDAKNVRSVETPLDCTTTTLRPLEERHLVPDPKNVFEVVAKTWPDRSAAALEHGKLLLPPGHWRITVTVRALFGSCEAPTDTWEVHASVEVDVLPKA